MRHTVRVLDERFHRSQRFSQREEAGTAGHGHGGVLAPAQGERNHAAECPHLAGCGPVAGVGGQSGVMNAVHGRVGAQELYDGLGVGTMAVHPHGQGLDPTQYKETVEGPGTAPAEFCTKASRLASSSSEVAMKPPTTSL